MRSRNPSGAPRGAHRSILAMRLPFPVAFFVAALITDIVYWRTADPLWSTMSSWLLLGGLVMATVAVLTEMVRLLGDKDLRRSRRVRIHVLGDGLAVLLSVANFVVHVRDGYSAVVPAGPLLSAAVVFILLSAGWVGSGLVHSHRATAG